MKSKNKIEENDKNIQLFSLFNNYNEKINEIHLEENKQKKNNSSKNLNSFFQIRLETNSLYSFSSRDKYLLSQTSDFNLSLAKRSNLHQEYKKQKEENYKWKLRRLKQEESFRFQNKGKSDNKNVINCLRS